MAKTQVYIADDQHDILLMIEDAFQKTLSNFDLHLSYDGVELLDLILAHDNDSPILIMADLNMPNKTGVEVLCELRSHKRHDRTPILMMTEHANERDREWLHGLGANYVFEKPSTYEGYLKLAKTIHRYWMISEISEMRAIFNERVNYKSAVDHTENNFLIVDDSLLHRLQLEKVLKHVSPKSIHYAYDGARAVSLFIELIERGLENIIVVITHEIPVMRGHKAAELIRKHETKSRGKSNSYIIIDAATSFNTENTKFFNERVERPYSMRELLAKIELAGKHFKNS